MFYMNKIKNLNIRITKEQYDILQKNTTKSISDNIRNMISVNICDSSVREIIYKKYNGKCVYCGKELDYKDMNIDHIVPVSIGGITCFDNLSLSCNCCNSIKGNYFKKDNVNLKSFEIINLYNYKINVLNELYFNFDDTKKAITNIIINNDCYNINKTKYEVFIRTKIASNIFIESYTNEYAPIIFYDKKYYLHIFLMFEYSRYALGKYKYIFYEEFMNNKYIKNCMSKVTK